jgi:HSP20 family protein
MSTYMPSVWSSIRPDVFDRQIDRLFDEALREFGASAQDWVPACNVWEDENGFYVQAALPGWEPHQISLEVNNKTLTIKGERTSEEAGQYHLHEIGGSHFTRLFTLPKFIDHEKAKAAQANGLLTISFPKREEAKARRILIEAA